MHDVSLNELRLLLSSRACPSLVERFEQTLIKIFNGGVSQMADFFRRLKQPPSAASGDENSQFTKLNKFSVIGWLLLS